MSTFSCASASARLVLVLVLILSTNTSTSTTLWGHPTNVFFSFSGNYVHLSQPNAQKTRPNTMRTNYASLSCGAKVLTHNPEVQHAEYVLSDNKDMYMINPCQTEKKWWVKKPKIRNDARMKENAVDLIRFQIIHVSVRLNTKLEISFYTR